MTEPVRVRRAHMDDLPVLQALQARSLRVACSAPETLGPLLGLALACQTGRVVGDTAWLAETADEGRIVAAVGYVPPEEDLTPSLLAEAEETAPVAAGGDAALTGRAGRICGLCVDPGFAGRGLERRMIAQAEAEMRAAGFAVAEVLVLPDAEPLWRSAGFHAAGDRVLVLPFCGLRVPVRRMTKRLASRRNLRRTTVAA